MRLQRVQVPNFRVLKDIDITFEDYHTPQIFPLASQNGGGKSTLLQLVFTLLNCCHRNNENGLIANILKNSVAKDSTAKTNDILSSIVLVENKNSIKLDFVFYTNFSLLDNFLTGLHDSSKIKMYGFTENGIGGYNDLLESLRLESQRTNKIIENLVSDIDKIKTSSGIKSFGLPNPKTPILSEESLNLLNRSGSPTLALDTLETYLEENREKLVDLDSKYQEIFNFLSELNKALVLQGVHTIYSKDNLNLVCRITSENKELKHNDLLDKISNSVFIAAPSSQVFLFLSSEEVSSLFTEASEYYKTLKEKQKTISNLFLYEFSMVKILTDAFRKAFDNDRAQAIKSGGKYGNEFELLFNNLKDFLNGKTIQPSEDMSRIVVKQIDINNQDLELSPADLSHGELRRLSLYAWIKTNKIKNSIVLIDEIEIGLHPDWQYQIVRDLEEWEPSNQYILATHSYEICSALSPAHVKEIEPKLSKVKAMQ
jgi:predicted ATP-dependent endonuclease of OLD family